MNEKGSGGQRNILIIDGDAINRLVLRRIFAEEYGVAEAENGRLGLELLLNRGSRFCAVLMNAILPGTSGLEVLRALNEKGVPERLPVFLITSGTGEDTIKEAYELGAVDVIGKPVVSCTALKRVESAIELFEARRSLGRAEEDRRAALLEQANQTILLSRGMLETLAAAIEFRSVEPDGHVQRISRITRYMLENTDFGRGLAEGEIENISLAAVLHDVGKITVPDALLKKPGRLTPEEYEVVKTHTTNGVLILESIPKLKESGVYKYARDIVLHHHERWDGGGYPEGLAGDSISPWAQVVSLADVYDSLSCERVYKTGYSRDRVLNMICGGECGVFGPKLLRSFLSVEEHISLIYS